MMMTDLKFYIQMTMWFFILNINTISDDYVILVRGQKIL